MKRMLIAIVAVVIVAVYLSVRFKSSYDNRPRALAHSTVAATALVPVHVKVFGAVRTAGTFSLRNPTLAEALRRATPYILSDIKRVQISHSQSGAKPKDITVDASRISESGATDIGLEDGDVVFVPEKIL